MYSFKSQLQIIEIFDHLKFKYFFIVQYGLLKPCIGSRSPTWVEVICLLGPKDFGTVEERG